MPLNFSDLLSEIRKLAAGGPPSIIGGHSVRRLASGEVEVPGLGVASEHIAAAHLEAQSLVTPPLTPHAQALSQELVKARGESRALHEFLSSGGHVESLQAASHRKQLATAHEEAVKLHAMATPQERVSVQDQMKRVEADKLRLDEEETHKRRALNKELTASQYAMVNFASSLASGDIRSAVGSAIGGLMSIGKLSTPATAALLGAKEIAEMAMRHGQAAYQRVQVGALELSPSTASTLAASEQGRRMAESRNTREAQANALTIHNEQLAEQVENAKSEGANVQQPGFIRETGSRVGSAIAGAGRFALGIVPKESPQWWNITGQLAWAGNRMFTGLLGAAQDTDAGRGVTQMLNLPNLEQALRGRGETLGEAYSRASAGASALHQSQMNRALQTNLKEAGVEPKPPVMNQVPPGGMGGEGGGGGGLGGVQAGVGTAPSYYFELVQAGLHRQDKSNENLIAQLKDWVDKNGALLTEIKENTNGLHNIHPAYIP